MKSEIENRLPSGAPPIQSFMEKILDLYQIHKQREAAFFAAQKGGFREQEGKSAPFGGEGIKE